MSCKIPFLDKKYILLSNRLFVILNVQFNWYIKLAIRIRRSRKMAKAENRLTKREKEVLVKISDGKTNVEIAEELIITQATAKAHVSSIIQKMEARDRTQAVVNAIRLGLLKI